MNISKRRQAIAVLCVTLLNAPIAYGQQADPDKPPPTPMLTSDNTHWYSGFTHNYTARYIPSINMVNSARLDSLIRGGKLYLTVSDAIALAIENNLDVEVERYVFPLADADLLRAKSGASTIGIPTGVYPGISATPGVSNFGSTSAGLNSSGVSTSLLPGFSYDPVLNGTATWGHTTTPQSNTILVGTPELVSTNKIANFTFGQALPTGATYLFTFNNQNQYQNSFRQTINPVLSSTLDLTVVQPLLQGFGLALNNRTIRVAKNDLRAADLVFKQQLTNTVANVVQLYWTLGAANLNVDVKRQAVDVSTRLVDQNKKQVEVGTLAPIEIVRAEAQEASDQQALVVAQSQAKQLESVLKSALSRNGLASPAIADADVVLLDQIKIPDVEPVQPMQDLVAKALQNRPDLVQSQIQLDNSRIALQGTKNELLPSLNLVGDIRNNALIGPQNTVVGPPLASTGLVQNPPIADPFFLGGYGDILRQLFSRNFPNYSIGFNLNIPFRNRAAQANMATATYNLRMNELQVQRQEVQIRVDIQNALIALQEARAQYQAAVKQRELEVQTVDASEKKLALGATTVYQVIQDQRDLSTAGQNVAVAQAAYAQARVQLDVATGATLEANGVEFDEAKTGRVNRPPNPIPANPPNQQGAVQQPRPVAASSR